MMEDKNTIQSFNFSFSLAAKAMKDVEDEHTALDQRIGNIIESENFYVNGYPVLKSIMMLDPKKSDLKKLSKALDRLAELVEVFDNLETKMTVLKTVRDDPNWFAWTFGDFSKELDDDLTKFFTNEI